MARGDLVQGDPLPPSSSPDVIAQQRRLAVRILKRRLTWSPSVAELCSTAAVLPSDSSESHAVTRTDGDLGHAPWSPPLLPSNKENLRELAGLLTTAAERAGSTSVFLIGPRGCGKSLVVHQAVRRLLEDGSSTHAGTKSHARVFPVYVNGRMLPDDQQALTSIRAEVEKEIARCSPPEDQVKGHTEDDLRSTLERFFSVTSGLERDLKQAKTVVLILDEFEVFATHTRQALLYSVFDSLQSPNLSLAVICLTCRLDVEQLLEKRVRSRHSGRKIIFTPAAPDELAVMARDTLLLPEELSAHDTSMTWASFAKAFNKSVHSLFGDTSSLPHVVTALLSTERTPPALSRLLFRAVCSMNSREGNCLELRDLDSVAGSAFLSSRLVTLLGLSVLELFLLVAARRLEQRHKKALNFTMVFEEYSACAAQFGGSSDLYSKEASRQAFQRLQEQGLMAPVPGPAGMGRKDMFDYSPVQSTVFPVELEVAVEKHKQCPLKLRAMLSQEINPGLSSRTLW